MIEIKWTASDRPYQLGELRPGHHQYVDRLYQFAYVPEELSGCPHVMTFGDDKMLPEDKPCFSLEVSRPCGGTRKIRVRKGLLPPENNSNRSFKAAAGVSTDSGGFG